MPYIITTRKPEQRWADHGYTVYDLPTRTAVATLDEARAEIRYRIDTARQDMRGAGDEREAWANARAFLGISIERGGTVGPLPDGTVIEVRPVSWWQLRQDASRVKPDAVYMSDAATVRTFNGAHA